MESSARPPVSPANTHPGRGPDDVGALRFRVLAGVVLPRWHFWYVVNFKTYPISGGEKIPVDGPTVGGIF